MGKRQAMPLLRLRHPEVRERLSKAKAAPRENVVVIPVVPRGLKL